MAWGLLAGLKHDDCIWDITITAVEMACRLLAGLKLMTQEGCVEIVPRRARGLLACWIETCVSRPGSW